MKMGYLAVAVSLLSLGAAGTRAQQPIMKVNVPFEFHVGREVFPAGRYSVLGGVLNGSNVQLAQAGPHAKGTFAQVIPSGLTDKNVSQPKLVFHQLGGTYYLAQIWDATGHGKELMQVPEEKELAQRTQPKEIAVAAN